MAKITDNVVKKIAKDIKDLLVMTVNDMEQAFIKMGDAKLPLSISVSLDQGKTEILYKIKLSFPSGQKIEHAIESSYDESQMEIEFPDDEEFVRDV